MIWQCGECGGLIDAAQRLSVCPECGTASSQILPMDSDVSELREQWLMAGMQQEQPLIDFANA